MDYFQGRNDKIDFIATQIPLPNSKEDFYRLLLELKPSTLVCLEILEDEQMVRCIVDMNHSRKLLN